MATAKQNWVQLLQNLEDTLEYVSFATWFSDLSFHKFEKSSGTLLLTTSDELKQSQLENHYLEDIIAAGKDSFGMIETVSILLPSDSRLKDDDTHVNTQDSGLILNPRFSFETFVVGDNNNFAFSCALAVAEGAEKPIPTTNPLFLYGDSGLGKTHLLQAIYQYIVKHYPKLRILFVSAEEFSRDYIDATRAPGHDSTKQMGLFKSKYRNLDVLIIDDIQFIQEKEKTTEEVFNTYNTLYQSGRQLIFSSDKPPKDLLGLDERLRSRLGAGILANLQPPSFEVKVAILKNLAALDNIPVTEGLNDVIELLATKIQTNIRELEGAFHSVVAFSSFINQPINKEMARQILHDVITESDAKPTPDAIKKKVAKHYEISVSDLESSKKARNYSFPRQIAMYLCCELTDMPLKKIGLNFGGRDHTTVIYAHDKIKKEKREDRNLSAIIKDIQEKIVKN